MTLVSFFLSTLLLVPYFAWGIFTLRYRYRFHEELAPAVEMATLILVVIFFAVELNLLRTWMSGRPIQFIFVGLGLFVSGTALYGPMLVSLTSQLFVEMVMPAQTEDTGQPQFAPAEALEAMSDFEGAIQEYTVMARIYPNDPATSLRIADNLTKLDRYEESIDWFERALSRIDDPEKGLLVANRLAEIYLRRLERHEDAQRILKQYIERFPDADRTESVRARLARLAESPAPAAPTPSTGLPEPPPEVPSE